MNGASNLQALIEQECFTSQETTYQEHAAEEPRTQTNGEFRSICPTFLIISTDLDVTASSLHL